MLGRVVPLVWSKLVTASGLRLLPRAVCVVYGSPPPARGRVRSDVESPIGWQMLAARVDSDHRYGERVSWLTVG